MKKFVFNMGFDSSHVISVLSSEGLEKGSQIFLLTPGEKEERQENAIREVENYLESVDVKTEISCVDSFGESFGERILGLSQLLSDLNKVVLSLSGGPREYLTPLAIAASINGENIEKTFMRNDIDNGLEEVEIPELPVNISDSEKDTLSRIEEGDTVKDLESKMEKSESTIYSMMKELEGKNLVHSEGSPRQFFITLSGRILGEEYGEAEVS